MNIESSHLIVVMGVSGCGKSTVGQSLAEALDLPYLDGDDLHPKHNIDKMSRGEPLTDADREPWLKLIRKQSAEICDRQWEEGPEKRKSGLRGVIVSCSALKRSYRETLRGVNHRSDDSNESAPLKVTAPPSHALSTIFVFLNGPKEILVERMTNRQGHYMKRTMLESQLDTLEDPMKTGEEGVIGVDIRSDPEQQVQNIISSLQLRAESSLHS